jgi:hypothetical protein
VRQRFEATDELQLEVLYTKVVYAERQWTYLAAFDHVVVAVAPEPFCGHIGLSEPGCIYQGCVRLQSSFR